MFPLPERTMSKPRQLPTLQTFNNHNERAIDAVCGQEDTDSIDRDSLSSSDSQDLSGMEKWLGKAIHCIRSKTDAPPDDQERDTPPSLLQLLISIRHWLKEQTSTFCYIMLLIVHLHDHSFLSIMPCLSMFVYGLCERNVRRRSIYWNWMLLYCELMVCICPVVRQCPSILIFPINIAAPHEAPGSLQSLSENSHIQDVRGGSVPKT
jgi:hypothetical protein